MPRDRRALVAGLAVVAAGASLAAFWPRGGPGTLVTDDFDGPDHLITNEWATYNPADVDAVASPVWLVTSGSFFTRDGAGWTGAPDAGRPDAASARATNSAVFRAVTRRADIEDAVVAFRLRLDRFVATPQTPVHPWDGVHVFLRYVSERRLYVVSVNRRDGGVAVKKKVSGGDANGGTYITLASRGAPAPTGAWHDYAVEAHSLGNAVAIRLVRDGTVVLETTDAGVGGPPITGAGRVGLRGDNAEFVVDDFRVTPG